MFNICPALVRADVALCVFKNNQAVNRNLEILLLRICWANHAVKSKRSNNHGTFMPVLVHFFENEQLEILFDLQQHRFSSFVTLDWTPPAATATA